MSPGFHACHHLLLRKPILFVSRMILRHSVEKQSRPLSIQHIARIAVAARKANANVGRAGAELFVGAGMFSGFFL